MNYLEASNHIFENAAELIQQDKVIVGLHYLSTKKNKQHCTFLVMKPFKKGDEFAFHLYPVAIRKMHNAVRLGNLRKFTITKKRHEKIAELQPEDVKNLKYQILPERQVVGVKADEVANRMVDLINLEINQNLEVGKNNQSSPSVDTTVSESTAETTSASE